MSEPVLIMAAPNGARRTKADHPALPMTISETARCAAQCFEAGASAIHVHVRDSEGRHVLDAALYHELIEAIAREAGPELVVQITTEAVGRYSPAEQQSVVRAVGPQAVSVALREMIPDPAVEPSAAEFYGFCTREDIAVQHILYAPEEIAWLADLQRRGIIPDGPSSALFVLGRYSADQESTPADLVAFMEAKRKQAGLALNSFMVCAFGRGELPSLATAIAFGGHARVGFENSLWRPDGGLRADNAEGVGEIAQIAQLLGCSRSNREQALHILGAA
ncbi:3-keto-5-aminohexanoate cleavage protein [Pelagibacterium lentulum]|uniref:3-keto-5-aminohexanoate cleavage enzyme n=1 Tax=Pelagibacterium lentulum TaxID=2029865 RepID=A0A916R982_9HYPH|nr:3-keto-5-aminohexanoate cleavage protein [Pelagibacterium lentulum]GGA44075.1 3-keto-5-aminohexanoate cleavage enzyme [Pelagibacterium lentulum]